LFKLLLCKTVLVSLAREWGASSSKLAGPYTAALACGSTAVLCTGSQLSELNCHAYTAGAASNLACCHVLVLRTCGHVNQICNMQLADKHADKRTAHLACCNVLEPPLAVGAKQCVMCKTAREQGASSNIPDT
jgi:hypothetical protein